MSELHKYGESHKEKHQLVCHAITALYITQTTLEEDKEMHFLEVVKCQSLDLLCFSYRHGLCRDFEKGILSVIMQPRISDSEREHCNGLSCPIESTHKQNCSQ